MLRTETLLIKSGIPRGSTSGVSDLSTRRTLASAYKKLRPSPRPSPNFRGQENWSACGSPESSGKSENERERSFPKEIREGLR